MKKTNYALPIFLLTLILISLACTMNVGVPDYSDLPAVPISTEYAQSIQDEVQRAFQEGAQTGTITLNLTEQQITSYIGDAGAPVNSGWQEVATKLDLAKAYQEMGDKDGARELLNEVVKEGDAAQQQQAKTMLAALR